jgi:hypothetical protein
MRDITRRKKVLPKDFKRVHKSRVFIDRTVMMNDIMNVPLHPKTGKPQFDKADVQHRGKIFKGWHSLFRVFLEGDRGFYVRIVLS